jgi:hypothetical protein
MARYANQPKALGICDRCGFQVRLNRMINQIIDMKRSGIMVCPSCNDIDQEQLQVGKERVDDAIALRNPRPDTNPGREPLVPYDPDFLNSP